MNFGQKITLGLLLNFVLGSAAFAQVVEIPDPNLRRAVTESLNLPANALISPEDMRQLTRLHAGDSQITDLTGLEHAANLETLWLWVNPLSDLSPIANLTKLKALDLGHCQVSNLAPLANLTQLVELQLNNNRISDITPLANLTNLRHLELQNNRIADIAPLANLTSLEYLDTHNNPIFDPNSPVVEIPDPNLRAVIRGTLNMPDGVPIVITPKN